MSSKNPKLPSTPAAGVPAVPTKKGTVLDAIRAGRVKAPAPARPGRSTLLAMAAEPRQGKPRLVFAIDATASREAAWSAAQATTDALFQALPGQLDVALAVHGASEVHTFTDFTSEPARLRDAAASVRCRAGSTQMVEIMRRTRETVDVKVLVYIGDVFEEEADQAYLMADALRLRGCRVIILHDRPTSLEHDDQSSEVFHEVARRTSGAVLRFDASSISKLRELLEAIGVFAAGGLRLLQARQKALPGAASLLLHLPPPAS